MAEQDDIQTRRVARAIVPFEADTTRLEEQLDEVVAKFKDRIKAAIETAFKEASTDRDRSVAAPGEFAGPRDTDPPDPILMEIKDTLGNINGLVMEIRDSLPQ